MRITEKAAHGMAVKRFRYILFVDRIGIIAGGILLFFAEEAFAACNDEGDDDALPFLQCAAGPGLHDLAHDLMTSYIARETARPEEHTSELLSLMRTSYAVFCLQQKK